MTDGVVDIGYVELFSASALMLVAGLVSWKLELGQTRRIAVSSVRCFVQLLAAGFLLTYLFEFQTWWLVLLVLAAFAASVFLYTQGWGYPTQETVVKELFANPEAASSTVFAKEVDADKAKTMVEPLVADANPAIDGVDKSMSDSTVYVTAKTEQGGDVQYKVSLVRDMIGWKVSSVELYFPSQN